MARLGRSYARSLLRRGQLIVGNVTAERGLAAVGVGATSTVTKVVAITGLCSVGGASTGIGRRLATTSGRATLGCATRVTVSKITTQVGHAFSGVVQLGGSPTKTASTRGLASVGVDVTGVTRRVATTKVILLVGVDSRHSGLVSRPQLGTCSLVVGGLSGVTTKQVRSSGVLSPGLATTGDSFKIIISRGTVGGGVGAVGVAAHGGSTSGRVTLALGSGCTTTRLAGDGGRAVVGVVVRVVSQTAQPTTLRVRARGREPRRRVSGRRSSHAS